MVPTSIWTWPPSLQSGLPRPKQKRKQNHRLLLPQPSPPVAAKQPGRQNRPPHPPKRTQRRLGDNRQPRPRSPLW